MAETRTVIAGNVRAELGRAGISQRELARRLSRQPQQIHDRLAAKVPFTAEELLEIAVVIGVPVSTLLQTSAVAS